MTLKKVLEIKNSIDMCSEFIPLDKSKFGLSLIDGYDG